ncbi:hypothetical protein [Streptomyces sp. NPDC087212]|uniref:hypothetical protein n=1 Tax=Streptomyces sp. NPDC087212 TaxID=3365766 RepID=UPI00383078C2
MKAQFIHGTGKKIVRLLRTYVTPTLATIGTGLLLGLVGPAAGKWDNAFCVALSLIFSGGWPWACYAFLVGYCGRSKTMSALLSFAGLTVGVIAYYVFKHLSPDVPPGTKYTTGEGFSSGIILWGVFALVLGVPMGLIGHFARRRDLIGLPFQLAVPLIAYFETTMRLDVEADGQSSVTVMTWNAVQYTAGALVLILACRALWTSLRHRHDRPSEKGHSGGSTA